MHQHGGTLAAHDIISSPRSRRDSRTRLAHGHAGQPDRRRRPERPRQDDAAAGARRSRGARRRHRQRNPPSLRVGYLPQERDLEARAKACSRYLARRAGRGADDRVRGARPTLLCDESASTSPLERGSRSSRVERASRAALASILLSRFDVYLLDEPTNDLDFAGLELLERFLRRRRGRCRARLARSRLPRPDGRPDRRARGGHAARAPLHRRLEPSTRQPASTPVRSTRRRSPSGATSARASRSFTLTAASKRVSAASRRTGAGRML